MSKSVTKPQFKNLARVLSSYAPVLVVALLLLSVETRCQQLQDNRVQRNMLMKLFEEALLNSSESLYALQNIYFLPTFKQSPPSVGLSVTVTVDKIKNSAPPPDCEYGPAFSNGTFYSKYILQLIPHVQRLSNLLTTYKPVGALCTFDPSFYSIMKVLATSSDIFNHNVDYEYMGTYINIHISKELEEMPCWNDAVVSLEMLLVWAKTYARAGGLPSERQDSDRSHVKFCTGDCLLHYTGNPLADPSNTGTLIVSVFVLSNLLVLSLTLFYFGIVSSSMPRQQGIKAKSLLYKINSIVISAMPTSVRQQQQQSKLLHVFDASATVLTFVNVATVASDVFLMESYCYVPAHIYHRSMYRLFYALKIALVSVILILEIPVVCYAVYKHHEVGKKWHKIFHAFALCQLVWFVHRFVNGVIISVLYFIITPAQTVGVVSLILSIIASAIAFAYIMFSRGCSNKNTCTFMLGAAWNGLITCGLLFVITLLYITFVDNGLESVGMGGFILSLAPTVVGFLIGLIIKRITQSEDEAADLVQRLRSMMTSDDITSRHYEDSEEEPLIND